MYCEDKKRLILTDFGTARLCLDLAKTHVGSPLYMFPNIWSGKKYDAFAADLWSMGIFLYEIATGELPYKANSIEELKDMWKSRKFNYPSHVKLSSCLKDLIDRMIVLGNISF